MGAAVGTDEKGSVNVELNIVPFIDLMSCLTAFLLVTAAWQNIYDIDIQPKGKAREADPTDQPPDPKLSVLIEASTITVGVSRVDDFQVIDRDTNCLPRDCKHWDKLKKILSDHKAGPFFKDKQEIEIAAESTAASPIPYQDVIFAMDMAVQAKFKDVGLTDAAGLSAKPTR